MSDIRDILELEQGTSVPSKEAIVGGNKVMNATQIITSVILCIEESQFI